MSKKVHFSKSQINEICDRIDEIKAAVGLNVAQNFQGMPVGDAVALTQKMAQANPSYSFTLDGQAINANTNPQIKKQEIIDNAKDVVDGSGRRRASAAEGFPPFPARRREACRGSDAPPARASPSWSAPVRQGDQKRRHPAKGKRLC